MKFFILLVSFALIIASAISVPVENDHAESDDLAEGVSTTMSPDAEHNAHLLANDPEGSPLPKEDLKDVVYCRDNGTLGLKMEFLNKVKHCMTDMSNPCSYYCQARSTSVLGDDNMPSQEKYDEFIQLAFPASHQDKVKEHTHECIKNLGAEVDPKDEKCEGANNFNMCIHKVFELTC